MASSEADRTFTPERCREQLVISVERHRGVEQRSCHLQHHCTVCSADYAYSMCMTSCVECSVTPGSKRKFAGGDQKRRLEQARAFPPAKECVPDAEWSD
jgi:hypothetical protein